MIMMQINTSQKRNYIPQKKTHAYLLDEYKIISKKDIHESRYLRFARLYNFYNQNVDKIHFRANYSLMEYVIT